MNKLAFLSHTALLLASLAALHAADVPDRKSLGMIQLELSTPGFTRSLRCTVRRNT